MQAIIFCTDLPSLSLYFYPTVDPFGENFCDVSYLPQRAIVFHTNKAADSVNDTLFSIVSGDETLFESFDAICKTLDYMADADLLYPP